MPELIQSMVDTSPTPLEDFDSQLFCSHSNATYRCVFESPGCTLEGMPFETLDSHQPRPGRTRARAQHQAV